MSRRAVVVAAVLAVSACTASHSRPGSSGSAESATRSSVPPGVTVTPTGSSPPAGSTGPSGTATVTPCPASDLAFTDTGQDTVHGSTATGRIRAVNRGAAACSIDGYPGMTLVAGTRLIPTRLTRLADGSPTRVVLKPGDAASFVFQRPVYRAGGKCSRITAARIYDPDGSGYGTTDTSFLECAGVTAAGPVAVPVQVGPFS